MGSEEETIKRLNYLTRMELKSVLTNTELEILLKYALEEKDVSANGYFIKPCIDAIGVQEVSQKILNYYQNGNVIEKAGALKLWYWVRETTTKFNPKDCSEITIESALENNKIELEGRIKYLVPEFIKCQSPILKFCFSWAIRSDDFKYLFKDLPETREELYEYLIQKNALEDIELLKKIFPSAY